MPSTELPVSAIILSLNEETRIRRCIESLLTLNIPIFLVDSGSADATADIAREYGVAVHHHIFVNYADQRNWAQDNLPITTEWVLHIDADESLTHELRSHIVSLFRQHRDPPADGYYMSRRTYFLTKWIRHGGHYPRYHLRLFRKAKGRCESRAYDQHFLVNGQVAKIKGDLENDVAASIADWLERHARWARAVANETLQDEEIPGRLFGTPIERRRWLRKNVYGNAPRMLRAFAFFLYRYIVRLGFVDGKEGLIFHFLQGCWFPFYVDALRFEHEKHSSESQ